MLLNRSDQVCLKFSFCFSAYSSWACSAALFICAPDIAGFQLWSVLLGVGMKHGVIALELVSCRSGPPAADAMSSMISSRAYLWSVCIRPLELLRLPDISFIGTL